MTNPSPGEAPKVVEAPPVQEPAASRSRDALRGREREAR
jgi:hypothetical protein